ncbi:MAG TPA: N-acetylmuramoyl-L-alanine amidase [Casimicrobiaceae bacterium]|nr:N-acetylmuramoyl-L-alanine amidase [Casimicrobiaceae bacterium]
MYFRLDEATPGLAEPLPPPAPDSPVAARFVQAGRGRFCTPGQAHTECATIAAPRAIRRIVIHALSSGGLHDCVHFGTVGDQVRAWQRAAPNPPGFGSSAHYLVDRDGTVTQMVREADDSFHALADNPDTIGIEHADICNKPDAYTTALYEASAALVRDIARRNNIAIRVFGIDTGNVRDATVVGHSTIDPVNRDDPGPYWDWEYYAQLLRWDGATQRSRPHRLVATAAGAAVPAGWQARRRVDVAGENRDCIPNAFCAQPRHSYGDSYWRAKANTPGSDVVFALGVGVPGRYKVSLWWPQVTGANASTVVSAEAQKGGGPARGNGELDQTRNFGRWNDLGVPFTFDVPGGGARVTVRVRRASRNAGWVLADAVRLLKVG